MKLDPGDLFAGKYRVERLLGEGGMGSVYIAVNERLHKRVALKVIGERVRADPALVQRFTQEAIAASRVDHPGTVEVFDADVHLGTPWIAMELLEGESLAARLARGPLPVGEAVELARRVLDALGAVHAAGIIHRDLKPDNVFCCRDGRVKILDFGIAKLAVGEVTGQTETGLALGTPFYLAPEQASSARDVGPAADLYSLGVVLYQMLSGALPYEATSLGDLVRQMYTSGPTRLATRAPHVPASLAALVDRCLAIDPAARPASAREVADALDRAAAEVALAPAPDAFASSSGAPRTMALDAGALSAALAGNPFGAPSAPHTPGPFAAPQGGAFGAPSPGGAFGAPQGGAFGAPPHVPTMAVTAAPVPPPGGSSGLGIGALVGCGLAFVAIPLLAVGGVVALMVAAPSAEVEPPPPPPEAIVSVAVRDLAPLAGADAERVRIDADGAPARGGAEPLVTIVTFSEFECPFCARVAPTMERVRETYGDRVRYVFRHNPLPFHTNALPAAQAAHEAYEQGGDARFFALHDVLFANQRALDRASLEQHAAQAGLDVPRLRVALDTERHRARVQRDMDAAAAAAARGTPAFFVNGRVVMGAQPYERFAEVIDEELALAEALLARGVPRRRLYETFQRDAIAQPAPREDTPAARPQADPSAIYRVPIEGSPARGPADALVTIVEISEFQCPFCARSQATLHAIAERYGRDVRFVFKHNPLPFHDRAMPAARLAIEADRQGRFWPVHDALFENFQSLDDATLESIARANGLDMRRVRDALAERTTPTVVARDQELARTLGATGTPTFFINGRNLRGAQPIEAFARVIDEELARARALVAAGTPRHAVYEAATRGGLTQPAPAAPRAPPSAPPAGEIQRYTLPIPPRTPSRGAAGAPLTIQVISDFQCPFCARAVATVDQIEQRYRGRVRIVFRHYPLSFHERAFPAAEASVEVYEHAGERAFWAYHDRLFQNQRALDDEGLVAHAAAIPGVDPSRVRAALRERRHRARVQADVDAVAAAGMSVGTPSFLIGTRLLQGAQPFEAFQSAIDAELAGR
ncbi:MAG: thioredoxin domain-containing protein [Sandaracinaceae bacterium]|nr:thioredoxin domain-containing protein [Sandaracinaceae bacterium]